MTSGVELGGSTGGLDDMMQIALPVHISIWRWAKSGARYFHVVRKVENKTVIISAPQVLAVKYLPVISSRV